MQDHTTTADERYVGGRDGFRLSDRCRTRNTYTPAA